ncbi:response regulator transcription factor [Chitinophaga agrisoli]|uniref:Response regulator transcription factor n=1 Tax=Chitinophaga agrisoli TaxID=2607653 RepID=A0A5B2VWQ7_9BACT|nr:response regulator transcription factor [Chitinophaga agrisoli]KAA2242687.1 response regulator transcription factor [Chitinophaga agrisoli]
MSIRIAIFDDNKNVRDGIALLLRTVPDVEIAGSFSHALDCVQDVRNSRPDVILMDIEMPGISGIEAVRLIKQAFPDIQILMQTAFEDDERVFASICAGASGYILKNHLDSLLTDSIASLQCGGAPMSPSIARKVLEKLQQMPVQTAPPVDYHLSPREKEVLACIVEGLSYKMIADRLHISYETVRSHVKKIYEKLHVASLTETVAKAINHKLI